MFSPPVVGPFHSAVAISYLKWPNRHVHGGIPSNAETRNDLAHDPMATRTQNLMRSASVGILALSYPLLAHLSTAQGEHGTLGALLAIGPVGLSHWFLRGVRRTAYWA